jgi:hypothetical protein
MSPCIFMAWWLMNHRENFNSIISRCKRIKISSSTLTEDNNITTEIKQLSPGYLGRQTKCVLHKTLVRPVLTYGSESWKDENMLQIFEIRILKLFMAQLKKMVYGD